MRPTSRIAAAVVSVLLLGGLAACELQGSCPAGATNVGTFAISYAQVDGGDTCVVTHSPDGGATDAGVATTPAATSATFCAATDAGTQQIYVHFAGDSIRTATTDGGTFTLSASLSKVSGTNCLCAVDISQSITGTLRVADGGTLTPDADGGFPAATQLSGSLDEIFAASAGSTDCACSPNPCGVHFALTGAP